MQQVEVCRDQGCCGAGLQRAVVRQGTARCAFPDEPGETSCQLTITFTPQAAVVKAARGQGDCGLGAGVYADETYCRTSRIVPQQFVNGEGTAVNFRGLDSKKYDEEGR